MICSSPLQVFKDLVPNCRGGEQFVNPRLVMVHLKGPIKYRYMLFRRGLDHKPFASKSTGTPQKNSEYSPLPLIPKLWSYKSTDAQMKLLLYVGDLALLSQQLYFISILCLPECIATAHPLCMLKIWSVRVLGSGQPIYIKCRQHCWLFRCCMRLYRVHNLIFCIFRRCYNMTFRIQPLCYRGFI